jgi:hypothetical protein
VALDLGEQRLDRDRVRAGQGGERGREVAADHLGRAVHVLARVARLGHRHALTPALGVAGDRAHQQHVALVLGAERGAERRHQRHGHPPQFEPGEVHESSNTYQPSRVTPAIQ